MESFQKTLTRTFVSKKGKVPTCMKYLSYIIVAIGISLIISTALGPTNDNHRNIVEGLVTSRVSNEKSLIYFHMDGCGYCKKFNPEWDAFVKKQPQGLTVLKLERQHPKATPLLKEFDISGFPTIVLVDSSGGLETTYDGPRTAAGLLSFCEENM